MYRYIFYKYTRECWVWEMWGRWLFSFSFSFSFSLSPWLFFLQTNSFFSFFKEPIAHMIELAVISLHVFSGIHHKWYLLSLFNVIELSTVMSCFCFLFFLMFDKFLDQLKYFYILNFFGQFNFSSLNQHVFIDVENLRYELSICDKVTRGYSFVCGF